MKYLFTVFSAKLCVALIAAAFLLTAPVSALARDNEGHDKDQTRAQAQHDHGDAAADMAKPGQAPMDKAAGPEDLAITAKVKAALAEFPAVTVNTEEGKVTLMGTVPSPADKKKALDLAGGVEGVKSVHDDMKIVE